MLTLYIDDFETLNLSDWVHLFGETVSLRPLDEQTLVIVRQGQTLAHLSCREQRCQKRAREQLGLTPKQQRVFELLVTGVSNREIAERLKLHEKTIAKHVSTILNKLGYSCRREVMNWYFAQEVNGNGHHPER